jgi:hypothetical protein
MIARVFCADKPPRPQKLALENLTALSRQVFGRFEKTSQRIG